MMRPAEQAARKPGPDMTPSVLQLDQGLTFHSAPPATCCFSVVPAFRLGAPLPRRAHGEAGGAGTPRTGQKDRLWKRVHEVSLTVASAECGSDLSEVDYQLRGDPDLVLVVALIRASAVDVGAAVAAAGGKELVDLEVAHVVRRSTGHDNEEDPAEQWPVATYWPDWCGAADVSIIALSSR